MKFLALIPARYASSRFPGKPLADIAGKPMIQHVYERASQVFDACWVATDDGRISDAVEFFGGRVVMTSPDHRSGTDRCREALELIEERTGERFDVVVNIQGDEPFIATEQLQQLSTCFNLPETDIATLVKPFGKGEDIFNPNSPKVVISRDSYALYFSRSAIPFLRNEAADKWQAKYPFLKHLGIYAYRSKVLREIAQLEPGVLETAESLEQLRWLENGFRIRVAVTDRESLAVDTPDDLERVREIFEKRKGK